MSAHLEKLVREWRDAQKAIDRPTGKDGRTLLLLRLITWREDIFPRVLE